MVEIEAGGLRLQLLPERAIFLPTLGWLLVADVHLGKADTFRRLGVPVPRGTVAGTLQRLGRLVRATGATRLVCLGDLVQGPHAFGRETVEAVAAWRQAHADLAWWLVGGNHDARAGALPPDWGVHTAQEPWVVEGLALAHHPVPRPGHYVLAGHLHPAVTVAAPGARRSGRLRLPCFHFGADVGVLPAFGEFTGQHEVTTAEADRVFLVTDDAVLPWSPPPPTLRRHVRASEPARRPARPR